MSDDLATNELIQGRSYAVPRFLTFVQNRFTLPDDAIIDVRRGTFLHNLPIGGGGGSFEPSGNGNLAQPPNSITDTADTTHNMILASREGNVIDGPGDSNFIASSVNSDITNQSTTAEVVKNTILGSQDCTISRTAVAGTGNAESNSIIGSVSCDIIADTTAATDTDRNVIAGCAQCSIDSAKSCTISGCATCQMLAVPSDHGTNTFTENNITSSVGSQIRKTTTASVSQRNTVLSSNACNLESTTNLIGNTVANCDTLDVTDCNNSFFAGCNTLTATGIDNAAVFGTPAAPLQSDTFQSGIPIQTDGNITSVSGYVDSELGYYGNSRRVNTDTFLADDDYVLDIDQAAPNLTEISVASVTGSVPADKAKVAYVRFNGASTKHIVTTGLRASVITGKGGRTISFRGGTDPVFMHPIYHWTRVTASDNSFQTGVISGANVLPSSSSDSNHATSAPLSSNVSFAGTSGGGDYSGLVSFAPGLNHQIILERQGTYRFTYTFRVTQTANGAGTYNIRADVTRDGAHASQSLSSTFGNNTIAGTQTVTRMSDNYEQWQNVTYTAALRITRDSSLGPVSTTDITNISMIIEYFG